MTPITAPIARPCLTDDEALSRAHLEQLTWLSSREAAFYMRYTADRYKDPLEAFMQLVRRHGIKKGYFGGRTRFRRSDLDRLVEGARERRGGA